jgi:nitric oxide reductase subunit B
VVIHLWVEGAWELVTGAIMAFIMMRLTGVDRQVVEKWLYVEVGLFLFTGIVGTGHHYYWIGAPKYWLWFGGVFSALEPLPILLMVIDTMNHVRHRHTKIINPHTWTIAVGCAVFHMIGAGVWGFAIPCLRSTITPTAPRSPSPMAIWLSSVLMHSST